MNCPRCKDSICPHKPSSSDKWRYTLITTVVLLVIMNPYSYKLMEAIFGKIIGNISNVNGCPTYKGMLLSAFIFTIIVRYMMDSDI
jgi:hypothetical protein